MIRQICPHCFQPVELPDAAGGTDAPCPRCGKPIPVPGAYTPTVDPAAGPAVSAAPPPPVVTQPPVPPSVPAPPPGFVPPKAAAEPPPAAATPTPAVDGYAHATGFTISPAVLAWVPVGCLTLALLLTFFSWVGSYPGGVRVYTQNPWQALFATFTTNTLPDELLVDEKPIEQRLFSSWWLLPYFPVLIGTSLLAWIERFVRDPDPATIPGPLAWVPKIWPRRFHILTGLTALAVLLVAIQTTRGFGLEVAIGALVTEDFAKRAEEADTTPKKNRLAVDAGRRLAQFGLQGTTLRDLALAAQVLALVTMAGRLWLHTRGPKPHPKLVAYW